MAENRGSEGLGPFFYYYLHLYLQNEKMILSKYIENNKMNMTDLSFNVRQQQQQK